MTEYGPSTELASEDFLGALEQQLLAAERRLVVSRREREQEPGRERARKRNRLRRPLLVVALLVVGATGAAFAARALIGAPAPRFYPPQEWAQVGRVVKSRLLALRVPDPAGGPPWGMRLIYTHVPAHGHHAYARGANVCLQVGRVLNGTLGVLGEDGAFHNDGLFHELPVEPEACGKESGGRPTPMGAASNIEAASASNSAMGCRKERIPLPGESEFWRRMLAIARYEGDTETVRALPRMLARMVRRNPELWARPVCPQADVRRVLYGFAGPHARTVTAGAGLARRTVPVSSRDERAWLVVLAGAAADERLSPTPGRLPRSRFRPRRPLTTPGANGPVPLVRLPVHPSKGSPRDSFTLNFPAITDGGGYILFLKAPRPGRCQRLAQAASGGEGLLSRRPGWVRGERVIMRMSAPTHGLCPGRYRVYATFSDPSVSSLHNWPFALGTFTVSAAR